MLRPTSSTPPFPYTTLFRSGYSLFQTVDYFDRGIETDICRNENFFQFIQKRFIDGAFTSNRLGDFGKNIRFGFFQSRSEEHTSELQSRGHLVCRLMLAT